MPLPDRNEKCALIQVALGTLLPPTCRSECLEIETAHLSALSAAEKAYIHGAAEKRQAEFATGRAAARGALAAFGLIDPNIPAGADRAPVWPQGIVGSITHSDGLAAAAVARTGDLLSIGLDLEKAHAVHREVWPEIFIRAEIEWLLSGEPGRAASLATVMFAVKESFYKFQYPLTGQWVGFEDIAVTPTESGGWAIHPQTSRVTAGRLLPVFPRMICRTFQTPEFVLAATTATL